MMKKTVIILLIALLIGGYVIFEYYQTNHMDSNEENDSSIHVIDSTNKKAEDGLSASEGSELIDNKMDTTEKDEKIIFGNQTGQYAPDFQLPTLNGEKISLSDFRGENVLVQFWTSWCPYCKKGIPILKTIADEEEVKILLVNVTTREKSVQAVENVVEAYEWNYPVLLDENGEMTETYQVSLFPTTYLINEEGRIVQVFYGEIHLQALTNAIDRLF